MTNQEFISKAKTIHGDKYNYDLVEYTNNFTKVKISCPIHGEFLQVPYNHIVLEYGCRKCGSERRSEKKTLKTEDFIKRAEDIYENTLDYSKSIYKGLFEKIEIICKQHGSFFRTPCNFLRQKNGCPQCNELSVNIEKFNKIKQELQNKDKGKYDYSLFTFQDYQNKRIPTICKKHGLFIRDFESHLYNNGGCQKCSYRQLTTKDFVQQSKDLHGNFYNYSKVNYCDQTTPVILICSFNHEFSVTPSAHLRKKQGCSICSSNLHESYPVKQIKKIFSSDDINFIQEKRFPNCKYKYTLPFDFYLPDYNCCIEYDGKHHFLPVFGEESFKQTVKNDIIKNEFCRNNNITLFRISYKDHVIDKINSISKILKLT